MGGTIDGGKAAAQSNKELHGEDFYKVIGAIGGRAKNPNKGFGSDRERARQAGILGGQRSKRKAKKVTV